MKILNYKKKVKEIMEQYPELRGLLYEKKHERYQKEVKEELGYVATEWDETVTVLRYEIGF